MSEPRPALAPATWRRLIEIGRARWYPRGSLLMAEGDAGGVVFALVSGSVDVVLAGGQYLASVVPGELVGELSAVDGLPRSASVIATTDVEVRAIAAPLLLETLQECEPDALPQFIAAVGRLRVVTEVAAIRAGGAPVGHVAAWIVGRLDDTAENGSENGSEHLPPGPSGSLFVELDPGEVAGELEISSELLSRALGHLATAGSVVLDHGRVLILDAAVLRRLARRE